MVQKRGAFHLRVSEEADETIDVWQRKFICEIYAVEDVEFKARLDKTWIAVPRTENELMDEVVARLRFIEYVDKCYSDLLRAAASPLENVMEDAIKRSFGWSCVEDSQDGFNENLRKSLLEDLGL